MKQDNEYIRKLLMDFESVPKPTFDLTNIEELGYDRNSDDFIFHFLLLRDEHLIEPANKNSDFGYEYDGQQNFSWPSNNNLRITARGHQFLAAVRRSEVWDQLKNDFKNESITTVIAAGLKLAESWAREKVNRILGQNEES